MDKTQLEVCDACGEIGDCVPATGEVAGWLCLDCIEESRQVHETFYTP